MATERLKSCWTIEIFYPLILKVLSLHPMHGWAISERLRQVSKAMSTSVGSIHPAGTDLNGVAGFAAEWGPSDNNRKANMMNSQNPPAGSSRPSPTSGRVSRRRLDSSSR